jgi:ABC-type antimicrobial peptide transport system permease subunit
VIVAPYAAEFMGGGGRAGSIRVGLAAAAFVLLIACANVANLLLARVVSRRREHALHAVLGAGRFGTLVRVLAESFCLALVATVLGLALAAAGLRVLSTSIAGAGQRDWPYWISLGLDGRTIAVAVALGLLTTLIAGLGPALRASLNYVLKSRSEFLPK